MSNTVIALRQSGETSNTPSLGVLANGELALNFADSILYFKTAANTLGTILTATPGGLDTEVQFNDAGSFGGDSGFTYNKTTNTLTIDQANIAGLNVGIVVQSSFDKANAANVLAQAAFNFANTANIKVDAAFSKANSANVLAQDAFNTANTANVTAEAGFAKANSANVLAQASFNQANSVFLPSVTRLNVTNNDSAAFLFDQYSGNNPTLYVIAGETIAFSLNVTGHPFMIRVSSGGTNYNTGLTHVSTTGTVSTNASAQGQVTGTLYWKVPAELASNNYVYQCSIHGGMVGPIRIGQPNALILTQANAAFDKANTANTTAEASFSKANTANVTAEASFSKANTANVTAESAFSKANTANVTAEASFSKANTANVTAESAFSKANSANVIAQAAFNFANTVSGGAAIDNVARSQANTAIIDSAAAFSKANSANVLAQAAFDTANNAATIGDILAISIALG